MLLKAESGYVQHIDEKANNGNWYFTVVCKDGEVGLITAHDLMTGEHIELGQRLEKCIFVKPEEYLELIEELESMYDMPENLLGMSSGNNVEDSKNPVYIRGLKTGISYAMQLVAQRANPPPGTG